MKFRAVRRNEFLTKDDFEEARAILRLANEVLKREPNDPLGVIETALRGHWLLPLDRWIHVNE